MVHWSLFRLYCLFGGIVVLNACALPPVRQIPNDLDMQNLETSCCKPIDIYPDPLVDMMEPKSETSALLNRNHYLRRPFLEDKAKTQDYVLRHLQPLDIVLISDKSQVSGWLIPGYFTHSLIYLGTEGQLRDAGLWETPAIRPYHAEIRAQNIFFEATPPEVTFSPAENIFDVDSVGVFRPDLTTAQKRAVLTRLPQHLGKPFDMLMDLSTEDCLFCAELINLVMPDLNLKQQSAYGRRLIAPDSIAVQGLTSGSNLEFIGFVFGNAHRTETGTAQMLAATINRDWPDRSNPNEAN